MSIKIAAATVSVNRADRDTASVTASKMHGGMQRCFFSLHMFFKKKRFYCLEGRGDPGLRLLMTSPLGFTATI